ncbi:hypothetical protein BJY52DRAFT_1420406 [Lactarius psammicola]|nr:hypothetical protein BJY52DRAFT_1420406 [Lactarius psammicola]
MTDQTALMRANVQEFARYAILSGVSRLHGALAKKPDPGTGGKLAIRYFGPNKDLDTLMNPHSVFYHVFASHVKKKGYHRDLMHILVDLREEIETKGWETSHRDTCSTQRPARAAPDKQRDRFVIHVVHEARGFSGMVLELLPSPGSLVGSFQAGRTEKLVPEYKNFNFHHSSEVSARVYDVHPAQEYMSYQAIQAKQVPTTNPKLYGRNT